MRVDLIPLMLNVSKQGRYLLDILTNDQTTELGIGMNWDSSGDSHVIMVIKSEALICGFRKFLTALFLSA